MFSKLASPRPWVAVVFLLACWISLGASSPRSVPPQEKNPTRSTNRLAKESSPYLLQHAHNPVDWFPGDQKRFAKAKSEKAGFPFHRL